MNVSRRHFLKYSVATGIAGLMPLSFLHARQNDYLPDMFQNPLGIPVELKGTLEKGKRVFDLSLQQGKTQFFQNKLTDTIGINGSYLGPVLRLNRGDTAVFKVKNTLNEVSSLHWHGAHLPAKMDGGPHQSILPNAQWESEFTIKQRATTLWYHSHSHGKTASQVYFGLAGLFYVDDEQSGQMDIPKTYGVDDFPLVLQDRDFNSDGSLQFGRGMHTSMMGRFGSDMLVNGTVRPKLAVTQRQVRFRILNGSNSRIYNLMFDDQREFVQIASDGGFLPHPVTLKNLQLSPGERAEILVTFANNEDVMLRHQPLPQTNNRGMGMGMGMMGRMMRQNDSAMNLMRFTTSLPTGSIKTLPKKLADMPDWQEKNAAKNRQFNLTAVMMDGFKINGKSFDMKRIDHVVKLNDIEIWTFYNDSPMPHPMHIHDIQFRILSRNGKLPPANERGLKDTVLVQPQETVRVITKFEDYADEKSPFMFHCHNLEHEDAGMMGQFTVVA